MVMMYVTKITPFGPYLQIFGQINFDEIRIIQSKINHIASRPDLVNIPNVEHLSHGLFCLAMMEERFARAKVINIINSDSRLSNVLVHFMDYAIDAQIPVKDLRVFKVSNDLQIYPIQVKSFIVCGVTFDWQSNHIETISRDIVRQNVELFIQFEVGDLSFANIFWKNKNLCDYILNEKRLGLMCGIDVMRNQICQVYSHTQQQVQHQHYPTNISIRGLPKHIPPIRQLNNLQNRPICGIGSIQNLIRGNEHENMLLHPSANFNVRQSLHRNENKLPTFNLTTLLVGNTYPVLCVAVENGPCTFSVQLKSTEKELNAMMAKIENLKHLRNINEKPPIGMACLARYSEDNQIYRAIIMSSKCNECQVLYIDYGNIAFVSYSNIYEITQELVEHKCFAMRFALSGYKELEPINDDLKEYFKKIIHLKTLRLKVMPLEGPPLVQYCELYDDNENVLNVLKKYHFRRLQYIPLQKLNPNDLVTISYIHSPKKFYIQISKMFIQFEKMMDDLFIHCNNNKNSLKVFDKGTPCTVKFENAWYRAEVIEHLGKRAKIRHVDYGCERSVETFHLNDISEKYLVLPPQAIQCCLKGFEDSDDHSTDTLITQFEMLAETSTGDRRQFKANIFQIMKDSTYLLNLIDDTIKPELNLMKRLFKLNMPFNKYIATEKNNFNLSKDSDIHIPQNNISSSTQIDNTLSTNWEKGSTGSQDSNNRRSNKSSRRSSPLQRKEESTRLNNRGGRGGARNLPPRLQKQLSSRLSSNNSNEKLNNYGSESNGRFSQTQFSRKSFQQVASNAINSNQDWSMQSETLTNVTAEEYLTFDQKIQETDLIIPSQDEVLICWWISPHQFYTHSKSRSPSFEKMMKDMQLFYKNKSPIVGSVPITCHVIARYKQDDVLYRAKIIAHNQELKKYRVQFIDFGNISIVNESEIWSIEKRFSLEPIMAQLCSFDNIISNYDHNYIISEIEKYLQPGSPVFCEYISKDNEMHSVKINLNGKSLKELLINQGLISEIPAETKLELLKDQRIKAKLMSIENLLNFKMEVEGCDIKFLCSYYDAKFAKINSQLLNKFKDFEGKYCIVDVLDVTTEKILMVRPIIKLFTETVPPPICQYPIKEISFNVKVCYVDSANKLYVHFSNREIELENLLDLMFEFYDKGGKVVNEIKVGSLVACLSSDGNWYRAQIKSVSEIKGPNNNDVKAIIVYYIDYGNEETIEINTNEPNIKRLELKFQEISALATEIYLPIKSIKSVIKEEILKLTKNVELKIHILECIFKTWICDLKYNELSLLDNLKESSTIEIDFDYVKELIQSESHKKMEFITIKDSEAINDISEVVCNHAEVKSHPSSIKTTSISSMDVCEEEAKDELKVELMEISNGINSKAYIASAYISHFNSPNSFYLQIESDVSELDKMQNNLQILASQLPSLISNSTGAMCIAKFSVDSTWYRAEIIDAACLAVKYIDYGNTDVIMNPTTGIKEIIDPFNKIKPYAIECSLTIEPKTKHEWNLEDDVLKSAFNNLNDLFQFEIVCENSKKHFVKLYKNGENIAENLCKLNLAKSLTILINNEKCFVSHFESLNEFYLQLDSDSETLETVGIYLTENIESFPILTDFQENICVALFPDDSLWYRAQILEQTERGFSVLFIDFGNKCESLECRKIPDDIARIPSLAKKCSLRLPDALLEWSKAAEEVFKNLAADGEQVFRLQLSEPKYGYCVIDLITESGGKNVGEEILKPLCQHKPSVDIMNASTFSDIMNASTCSDIMTNPPSENQNQHTLVSQPVVPSDILISKMNKLSLNDNSPKKVLISHINSPEDFYIQYVDDDIPEIEKITDFLLDAEKILQKYSTEPKVDDICAALFPEDGIFYRAKILEKKDLKYLVLFIDFGNVSETEDVRQLPENYLILRSFSKQCSLYNPKKLALTHRQYQQKFNEFLNDEFEMKIIDSNCVQLLQNGENIYDMMTFPVKRETVIVSHVVKTEEFYVQFETESIEIEKITEELLKELQPLDTAPKSGEIYAAQFQDDKAFYRGTIQEICPESEFKVFFIDFGNSSICKELRILPENLKKYSNLAHKCRLQLDVNSTDLIEKKFEDLLNNQHFGETFQMELIEEVLPNYWEVQLYTTKLGKNITDELKEMLIRPDIEIEKKFCKISHCNDANDFYVQLTDDATKLEEITIKLANAEKEFKKFQSPNLNDLYAAKFPVDGAYYRARILSKESNDDYEVMFIDFGNKANTSEILELPAELKLLPSYAKQCKLLNPHKIDLNREEVIECFRCIINSHSIETFQIQVVEEENQLIVNLYRHNINIVDELLDAIKEISLNQDCDESELINNKKQYQEHSHNNSLCSGTSSDFSFVVNLIEKSLSLDSGVASDKKLNDAADSSQMINNDKNFPNDSEIDLTAKAAEVLHKDFQKIEANLNIIEK